MFASKLPIVVAIAVACGLPCLAAPAANPGEWQITATSEMTGLPMQMPPQTMTFKSCVTADDLLPKDLREQPACKIFDVKTEGKAVTWTVECEGPEGKMKGAGRLAYQGDTMDGEQKMQFSAGDGMNVTILMRMSGKRLGPCKEAKQDAK